MRLIARTCHRLLRDEHGQDLVEYGLLTAFIGLAGIAAWNAIRDGIGLFYSNHDSGAQNMWHPQDPGSAQGYKPYK